MFSMGLTLTTEDFKILAQRPFDICVGAIAQYLICLLYTSDAADEEDSVDLGGRRIINKKNKKKKRKKMSE